MSKVDSPTDDTRIGEQTSLWAKTNKIAVDYHPSCESTSDLAKKEAFSSALENLPLKIYLTDQQTAGRGRGNNTWVSTRPGQQLLMTLSYSLANPPRPTLSPRLGLALWTAVRATWPTLKLSLKAPNDLYVDDKKVAGLLLENILQGGQVRCLIGLGLNVFGAPPGVDTSTHITNALPAGAPLLSDDWFEFCDRLFLEFAQALHQHAVPLNSSDQIRILVALNSWTSLRTPYTKVDADGNLWQGTKKISWSEL